MQQSTGQLIAQLKALADPARLRLLALCARAECSVTELAGVLGLSQPRVSQHLKALCDAGLLQRFRDGHFVYYRVPLRRTPAPLAQAILDLLPADEPQFGKDLDALRAQRTAPGALSAADAVAPERELHRALIELTVAAPLGDVLDIGCGHGSLLKLLASRARRAVGVDIDADARQLARAQLLFAGINNCTLRNGDMYALPLDDAGFDTVIIDDLLAQADRPMVVLAEAARVLRPGGRVIVLARTSGEKGVAITRLLAEWCAVSGLRLAPPRAAGGWLLAVATPADGHSAAA